MKTTTQSQKKFFDNTNPDYAVKRFVYISGYNAEIAFHNDTPANVEAIQQYVQTQSNITLGLLPVTLTDNNGTTIGNQLRLRFMSMQPYTNIHKTTDDAFEALKPYMSPEMQQNIETFLQEKSQGISF